MKLLPWSVICIAGTCGAGGAGVSTVCTGGGVPTTGVAGVLDVLTGVSVVGVFTVGADGGVGAVITGAFTTGITGVFMTGVGIAGLIGRENQVCLTAGVFGVVDIGGTTGGVTTGVLGVQNEFGILV